MATFNIPKDGSVRQLNINDTAGELWSTFNIDLHTNPGKMKLARPFKRVASSAEIDDDPVAGFAILAGNAYAVTDSNLYTAPAPYTTWSVEDTTPAFAEDMVTFKGQLVITTNNNLDAFDGTTYVSNWWTARSNPALTDNSSGVVVPHVMEVLRIGAETLAVTDGSEVHAYTGGIGSGAIVSVTVELDASMVATCIKSSIRQAWIGTYTEDGDQAFVYEWDGASTNYTQAFPVGAKAVLAMELVDDVPVIVTERGEVKMFNGAGFVPIAQLPFATSPRFVSGVETGLIQTNNLSRPIHPKGMKRSGNTLYIATNFTEVDADIPLDERTPAGLWALNLTTYSLSHLGSPDNQHAFTASTPIMIIDNKAGRLFIGGRTLDDETGIWLEDLADDAEHQGHFTTVEYESESVTDAFNAMYVKALLGSTDEVMIKYRVEHDVSYPVIVEDVAWSTASVINSTSPELAYVQTRFDAGHRDEVEILTGVGAGKLVHIVDVSKSASTYSVTVDEAIGTAPEISTVRVDNWIKIPVEMTEADGQLKKFGTEAESSTWAQFRVRLKGKAGLPEVRGTIVKSENKTPIN